MVEVGMRDEQEVGPVHLGGLQSRAGHAGRLIEVGVEEEDQPAGPDREGCAPKTTRWSLTSLRRSSDFILAAEALTHENWTVFEVRMASPRSCRAAGRLS
jgi:hypothetical protein